MPQVWEKVLLQSTRTLQGQRILQHGLDEEKGCEYHMTTLEDRWLDFRRAIRRHTEPRQDPPLSLGIDYCNPFAFMMINAAEGLTREELDGMIEMVWGPPPEPIEMDWRCNDGDSS